MMKRSIAFALICSFTISLWAQTFKGRVVDLAGNPIPYAALYLKELKTGFTTDDNGCFLFHGFFFLSGFLFFYLFIE